MQSTWVASSAAAATRSSTEQQRPVGLTYDDHVALDMLQPGSKLGRNRRLRLEVWLS
jgi:hypothetical protein